MQKQNETDGKDSIWFHDDVDGDFDETWRRMILDLLEENDAETEVEEIRY